MWECDFAREPINYRLLWLRLLKKCWLLLVGVLLGSFLIGGGYYLKRVVIDGRTYEAKTLYYQDFAEDGSGKTYDYYNHYTWNEVIHSDFFIEELEKDLNGSVTEEELLQYVSATIESDVRYLYTRCTTKDPELCMALDRALQKAVIKFGENQKEFKKIGVSTQAKEATDVSNIRTGNAFLLGAFLGFFLALVGWLVGAITDTSVYLPATLEKRYRIKCLGAPSMKEYESNLETLLPKEERVYLMSGDQSYELTNKPKGMEDFPILPNIIVSPEQTKELKNGAVVVYVKSGAHNGKQVERTLEQLKRQEIKVVATLLVEEDAGLINRYYKR